MTRTQATLERRKLVHEGRIFRVELDRVRLPGGQTADLEIVRHPGSVVMLPVPAQGRLILVRQYRYAIDRWIWELPAGTLKPSEDPRRAAARECEEEIGLVPYRIERLAAFFPTPGFCDEEMTFFRCSDLRPPAADSVVRKDEDEDLEPQAFALDDVRRMVDGGEIVDLKTAVGLTLLEARS